MDRTSRFSTVATAAFLTSLLTACGGGGGSSLPATPSRASTASSNATMRLTIPAKSPALRAKYVSASTQSVVLTVNGTALPADNTTATSPGCSSTNGAVVCSFAFSAPVGSVTIGVKAYDAANGGGNLLSQGTVTQTLVAGSNVVPVALGGVTASLAVSAAAINAGTAGTTPVIVQAKDADGNVIVGAGNYSSPITVTDGDATGITTLSVNGTSEGTSATVNSPNDAVVLTYNGKNLYSATLTPSATGVANATAGSFAPTLTYLGTYQLPSVSTAFIPAAITVGGDGKLWIAANATVCCGRPPSPGSLFAMTTSGAFTEFDPLTAPSTALQTFPINSIAGTPPGSAAAAWFIYTLNTPASQVNLGSVTEAGVVTNYPVTSICSGATGTTGTIIADAAGGAWFEILCSTNPNLQIGHITSGGTVTLSSVLSFRSPGTILLARDGNLYAGGNDATGAPAILQAIVSGATITGTNTLSSRVGFYYGIAQSDDGDFWLSSPFCPSAFARLHVSGSAFSSGVVSSYDPPQGCTSPGLLFNGGNNTIWAPNFGGGITQLIPGANQGAPVMTMFNPPLPNGLSVGFGGGGSSYVGGVIGPDGLLYFADGQSDGEDGLSGAITRLAY